MPALHGLKISFIIFLLIVFFIVFGWDSLKKYKDKHTIVLESWRDYDLSDQPAITVCATANGDTGWRDPYITERVFETICGSESNAEEASKCVEKNTFNFSEMIVNVHDTDKNSIDQTNWHLYQNLFFGKCFVLNSSVAQPGSDWHHPLSIQYPNTKDILQYTLVHDPNFFILGPNPETIPRLLQVMDPSYGTKGRIPIMNWWDQKEILL